MVPSPLRLLIVGSNPTLAAKRSSEAVVERAI